MKPGELVLVTKPFWERGTGMILPQSDGPFMIDKVFDGHTCSLIDAVSQIPFQQGQRIWATAGYGTLLCSVF